MIPTLTIDQVGNSNHTTLFFLQLAFVAVGAASVIVGCATPVAPSGGPPDTTPPALVSSIPEPSSVNFSSDRITLTFSEKVDRASLQRSLSFTPEIILTPELQWHGEIVDLVFRGPLRDSTTYILTLDNELKDNRGVAASRPITLAFSTGPTIDKGRIDGRVADPTDGAPVQRIDVFAFEDGALPGVAGQRREKTGVVSGEWKAVPSYRTQTGSDGTFSFANLPQKPFFVVAVEDRNRNRLVDSTEAAALPSWGVQFPDTGATAKSPLSWYLDRSDRLAPSVIQLQSLSSRRTEVRFSEPVRLDTLAPVQWVLADTLTSREYPVSELYQPPGSPNRIILVTDSLQEGAFVVRRAGAVRDSAGNPAEVAGVGVFLASSRYDTLRTRFGGFAPASLETPATIDLGSGMHPEIRFNRFVDPSGLFDMVEAGDSEENTRAVEFQSADGTTWMLTFRPEAEPGDSITVEVSGVTPRDTIYSVTYAFLDGANTGSITGTLVDSVGGVIQIFSATPLRFEFERAADSTGGFQFGGLLKGNYRIRAFVDLDGDGLWTPGRFFPRRLPEPLVWREDPIEVRKGWESGVDTLRFVVP
ncbi:MAG: Ig-like domain-containing protein [Rhodothermia bacterium]